MQRSPATEATSAITTEQIEATVVGGFRTLRFPEPLERAYWASLTDYPRWFRIGLTVTALGIMMRTVFTHWSIVSAGLGDSAIHLVWAALQTLGFALVFWYSYLTDDKRRLQCATAVAVLFFAIPNPGTIYAGPAVISDLGVIATYPLMVIACMIAASILYRLRFWLCVGLFGALMAFALWFGLSYSGYDLATLSRPFGLVVLIAVLMLCVSYELERQSRLAFLQHSLLMISQRQLQEANERLRQLATRDPLTGLANRRALDEFLATQFKSAQQRHGWLALAMVDIDYFKRVNDSLGHPVGDECLIRVADALVALVDRPSGMVARYGGEEFAAVFAETDGRTVADWAERARQAIEELQIPAGADHAVGVVTVSVGVAALRPGPRDSVHDLVRAADCALYEAKRGGRNRVALAGRARAQAAA
ncbi:MAG: diguanylate cyclase [Dehalococcoidia bacterium]|nr:diguanylate cyclase [Dehalococcoidia bacterium]